MWQKHLMIKYCVLGVVVAVALLGASASWANQDFALNCKRQYHRGMDYYLFFSIGGKAAIASKAGYPVLGSKEGILQWEDLKLQKGADQRFWYLTVKQYPTKSNYGDKREWYVENEESGPPKLYLRLSLPFAKGYDDRVVIYDIVCERIDKPKILFEQAKQVYQRDLEMNKYKFDIYSNFGFQIGPEGRVNNPR